MNFIKAALIIFSLVVSASYAQEELETKYVFVGKNYGIRYMLEEHRQVIWVNGLILSTHAEKLSGFYHVLKLIRKDVPVLIVLNSGGGFLANYEKLIKAAKKSCDSEMSNCRITTYVPSLSNCASACINIFMGGDDRVAAKSTYFGFHQGSALPGMIKIPGFAQKALKESGVDSEWLKTNNELFSSMDITWRRPEQLDGSNIITEIRTIEVGL